MAGRIAGLARTDLVAARKVLVAAAARGEHVPFELWEALGVCEDAMFAIATRGPEPRHRYRWGKR